MIQHSTRIVNRKEPAVLGHGPLDRNDEPLHINTTVVFERDGHFIHGYVSQLLGPDRVAVTLKTGAVYELPDADCAITRRYTARRVLR